MGTNEGDMGHLKDAIAFSDGVSTTRGCYVTGKPVILGGIPGRREATGRGVMVSALKALEVAKIDPRKATAIVQGFGNVGAATAVLLHETGVKVIGASDITGAVFNPTGLDVPALDRHVTQTGGVRGFTGGEPMDPQTLPRTCLRPAHPRRLRQPDHPRKRPASRAKMIVEGANGPTSVEADEILAGRGVLVYPDILCNAGGVFVSYLEYTQETQAEQMTQESVRARLTQRMSERFEAVCTLAKQRRLPLRDAAMCLAVKTVCEALEARGRLP